MALDSLKVSLKELIAVVTIAVSITLSWANLKSDIKDLKDKIKIVESLKEEVSQLKKLRMEIRVLNGQIQWLYGEGSKSGWNLPRQPWVLPPNLVDDDNLQ